jgi:CheY-like chemotaxis protein
VGDVNYQDARVLVVDDNEMNRDILARRLSRIGLKVDTAEDGNTGLDKILTG